MNVAAIIVTRGDVDCDEIVNSFPEEWEAIVWDNSATFARQYGPYDHESYVGHPIPGDLSVYGRYAAIEYADAELIYVQDDDCVVSDPQAIVGAWQKESLGGRTRTSPWLAATEHVVCNMPPEFRHDFYKEHALVGFGAVFHRDAPARAFRKFQMENYGIAFSLNNPTEPSWFHRTCDIVFTGLTPRVLADVPKMNLPWADAPDRMWMQPTHQAERARMLDLVKEIPK